MIKKQISYVNSEVKTSTSFSCSIASSSESPTDAKDGLLNTTLATESKAGLNFWLSFFLQQEEVTEAIANIFHLHVLSTSR